MIIDDRELGTRREKKSQRNGRLYPLHNTTSHTHAYARTLIGALNQALVGDEIRLLGAGLARHGGVSERASAPARKSSEQAFRIGRGFSSCASIYGLMARWLS